MIFNFQHLVFCSLLLCSSHLSAQNSSTQKIEINFEPVISGQVFECGKSYSPVGLNKSTVTPSDWRMYVSDIRLVDQQGRSVPVQLVQDKIWQFKNLVLLDFENGKGPCRNGTPATNSSIRGTVPKGVYSGIRFQIGIPFELNHGDPTIAPSPLNSTAMFWNWQSGYKFIKFDTTAKALQNSIQHQSHQEAAHQEHLPQAVFAFHLGSTQCIGNSKTTAPTSCQNPNRVEVELLGKNPLKSTLKMDMSKVLEQVAVERNAPNTPPGCMSSAGDSDCAPIMSSLGLSYDGVAASSISPQQMLVSWK